MIGLDRISFGRRFGRGTRPEPLDSKGRFKAGLHLQQNNRGSELGAKNKYLI